MVVIRPTDGFEIAAMPDCADKLRHCINRFERLLHEQPDLELARLLCRRDRGRPCLAQPDRTGPRHPPVRGASTRLNVAGIRTDFYEG